MATDVSMRRPRRTLSDQEQRDLKGLLAKPSLGPLEQGKLAALSRRGTDAQQTAADAKLYGGPSVEQVGMAIAKAAGSLLNDEGR
jgi:hypothetical protein